MTKPNAISAQAMSGPTMVHAIDLEYRKHTAPTTAAASHSSAPRRRAVEVAVERSRMGSTLIRSGRNRRRFGDRSNAELAREPQAPRQHDQNRDHECLGQAEAAAARRQEEPD